MTRCRIRRSGVLAVGAVIVAIAVAACGTDADGSGTSVPPGQEATDEHGASEAGEGGGEHGGSESGESGGEESATQYALNDTYDEIRAGARLIVTYDVQANAFTGTVENTTNSVLSRVRVEVHLSNGVELGPTAPTDLSPGQVIDVTLAAGIASFETWSAHPEVGGTSESGEGGGESGEHGGSESDAD